MSTTPATVESGSVTNISRWSMAGMTALVTDGTRGIGYAVVEELVELGAAVHTCSRNKTKLNQCLQEWSVKGFTVTGSICDVTSRPHRQQLLEKKTPSLKLPVVDGFSGHRLQLPIASSLAWEMVRDNPLWCDIPPVGCKSQSTTKRPKPNEAMGSANAHININLDDDDEDININLDRDGPRIYYEPDMPTRKGKRYVASSSSHDELIQQMAEFNSFNKEKSQQRFRLREEKLRVLQEEKDASVALMRRQQQALDE
ncbi:hypothetical protein E3N88_23651 [Mikania micrantha]|uniref:Uncharacterized protein n=1 Tax=Mikania micrantha TaxID=192012 RepID=A0A5N6NFH6_9ASTR|nr:hypothetical protein E3N88_23651 [Mikania micrantha]